MKLNIHLNCKIFLYFKNIKMRVGGSDSFQENKTSTHFIPIKCAFQYTTFPFPLA